MNADHVVRDNSNRLQDNINRARKEAGRGCYVNNPYAITASYAAPLPPVVYHHTLDPHRSGSVDQVPFEGNHQAVVRPHLLPSMPQQARPPQLHPGPPHSLPSLGTRPQALKSLRNPAPTTTGLPRNYAPFVMVAHKFDSQRYVVPKGVELAAGDLVVVDGDRGMNLGVVERLFNKAPHYKVENNVVRIASEHDCEALRQQRLDEEAVRLDVQSLADNLAPNMNIRGIEYQFDRQKMTIFYVVKDSAPGVHVDFRRLQRVLYSRYGCRIWIKDFKGDDEADNDTDLTAPLATCRHAHQATSGTSVPQAHPPKQPREDSRRRKSVVENM